MNLSPSYFTQTHHLNTPLLLPKAEPSIPDHYIESIRNVNQRVNQLITYYLPPDKSERDGKFKEFHDHYDIQNHKIYLLQDEKKTLIDPVQAQILFSIYSIFLLCLNSSIQSEQARALPSQANLFQLELPHASYNYLENLPVEILSLILSFVPFNAWQDIGHVGLTNKRLYQAVQDACLLKFLFEKQPECFTDIANASLSRQLLNVTAFHPQKLPLQVNLNPLDFKTITNHSSRLQHLSLQGGSFSLDEFKCLLQQSPELMSLEFQDWQTDQFDEYITAIGLFAPQIKHLKIIDCKMTDQALFALTALQPLTNQQLHSFEYWNSIGQGKLSDYSLFPFLSTCNELETLKLTGCPLVTLLSLKALTTINPQGDLRAHSVKHLTFSYCGYSNEQLFADLARFDQLETLELSFIPNNSLEEEGIRNMHGFEDLSAACPHLQTLKIKDCTYFSTRSLERFLDNCPNLRCLELYRNHNPTPTPTILKKIRQLPHLQIFKFEPHFIKSIDYSPFLNDASPATASFTQLETLALINYPLQEQDLIMHVKRQGKKLKHVQLFNCGSFSEAFLKALGKYCPHLETLEIDTPEQTTFTDESLQLLTKGCPSLKTLHLKSVSSPALLSAQTLKELADNCLQLKHVTLSHMDLVNGDPMDVLRRFTKRCIHLVHIGFPSSFLEERHLHLLLKAYAHQLYSLDLSRSPWFSAKKEVFMDELLACKQLQCLTLNQKDCQRSFIAELQVLPFLKFITIHPTKSDDKGLPKSYPFSHLINILIKKN